MSEVSLTVTQGACCLFQCDSTAGLLLSLLPPLHIPVLNISAFPFLTLALFLCSYNSHAHYFTQSSESQACLFNASDFSGTACWRPDLSNDCSVTWLSICGSAVMQHLPFLLVWSPVIKHLLILYLSLFDRMQGRHQGAGFVQLVWQQCPQVHIALTSVWCELQCLQQAAGRTDVQP